jgi:hypothetical protein
VSCDVLHEEVSGFHFANDSPDLIPDPALVGLPELLSGDRLGLAGVTGTDKMNSAAIRSAIEGGKLIP